MQPSLAVLGDALAGRSTRLAVFDLKLRERTGQWYLEERVPLAALIEALAEEEAFARGDGTFDLPLHEVDSAALTDECLRISPGTGTAVFYDPGVRKVRTVAISDLERLYPAWRCRFWTDAYAIEEPPPFLYEHGDPETFSPPTPDRTEDEPTAVDATAFFESVRSAIVASKERRRERARAAFERLPAEDFFAEYGGIVDLRPAGRSMDEYGQQVVHLRIPDDHELSAVGPSELAATTGLATGDEVIIDARSEALPIEAELFDVQADGFELGVYWDSAKGRRAEEAFDEDDDLAMTVGKLVDGRRFSTIANAVETVDRTEHARARYVGELAPSFTDEREVAPERSLNRDQQAAVTRSGRASDVCWVHAPPWTGARRVIWELVRHRVDEGDRVLVVVPSDDDIDSLIGPDDGEPGEAATLDLDVRVLRSHADEAGDAAVVVTSPAAAAAIDDHSVDVAILDQAARIDVPTGAIPFAKAGTVIAFGDPHQGGPEVAEGEGELPASIFAHLRGVYPDAGVHLRCQYRMHEAIAQFPDRHFYDSSLVHGGADRRQTIDTLAPLAAHHVEGEARTTPTGSRYHDREIDVVTEEVEALLDRGVPPEEIGIITPYSAQVGKLRVALRDIDEEVEAGVRVGGVDRFRCRSRAAMLVSFVGAGGTAGGRARIRETDLNVAMTRARSRLVLVGDWTEMRDRGGAFGALADFLAERGILDAPAA